jgi:A/G-specific adenine glycosylase
MRDLWLHAQAELPAPAPDAGEAERARCIRAYTQGLMDLGATICTRTAPACSRCPLESKCAARRDNAVARFPAPRPRREVPVREVGMLLLCRGGSVLIERRPPVGIWGGLWSLPEIRADDEQGCAPAGLSQFARFEHVFTHFRMKASVWRADLDEVQAAKVLRQAPPTRWLPLADAAAAPLPRPVKSLLLSLADAAALPGLR